MEISLKCMIDTKGLDENLAEAVDKAFYEDYKTWKLDHPDASTRQRVNLPITTNVDPKFRFVSG